ncbi:MULTISPECIES: recombinase family protein [Nocardiopsis]|uniref:recombinase family protein n=1 Tax=Nocardiopsis TaxID=2013 RepID=UPI001F2B5851|nr:MULTISPECIES: recombinase family protein [Nocardiopsis]
MSPGRDRRALTDLRGSGVSFGLGASVYDWTDPVGRLFLRAPAMVAESEADTGHQRTREGTAPAKKDGKLKGKQPKLTARQQAHLAKDRATGGHIIAEIAEGMVGGEGGVLVPLDQLQRVLGGPVLVVGGAEVDHAEELQLLRRRSRC